MQKRAGVIIVFLLVGLLAMGQQNKPYAGSLAIGGGLFFLSGAAPNKLEK
jgi:hypothetical protein